MCVCVCRRPGLCVGFYDAMFDYVNIDIHCFEDNDARSTHTHTLSSLAHCPHHSLPDCRFHFYFIFDETAIQYKCKSTTNAKRQHKRSATMKLNKNPYDNVNVLCVSVAYVCPSETKKCVIVYLPSCRFVNSMPWIPNANSVRC